MTTLQLLWLRPLPLETNKLPHLPELSVPYSITPTLPKKVITQNVVRIAGWWRDK